MTNAKHIPISKYMSPVAHTAAPHESLANAHARMVQHGIRHLPVQQDGDLVGVLFKSDLRLLEVVGLDALRSVNVDAMMIRESYTVAPDTPIDRVAREMSKQKYGSAIVVDQGEVIGVFTNTDALRALSDSLTDSLPPSAIVD